MDEPCSALDPIATSRIEDLMDELKRDYTIVIVTHNMQQAARVSDMTAFMTVDVDDDGRRTASSSSTTRREDLHNPPTRAPRVTSPVGSDENRAVQRGPRRPRGALQEEGELVLRAIRGAVDALRTQDVELCDEVIAFDDEIDAVHRDPDQIQLVLARQTPGRDRPPPGARPAPLDLHIERMGDQCVTIAKL